MYMLVKMFKLTITLFLLELVLGSHKTKHPSSLDGRIVGGKDADIADYPYQIALLYENFQICGGAIISPKWVITAAHCVYELVPNFQIRAGSSKAKIGGQVIKVSRIIPHPKFDYVEMDYDAALLELSSEIVVENASPIKLPHLHVEDTTIPAGAPAIVTGWGVTEEQGDQPDVLQVVEIPVISQKDCRLAYAEYEISDRMFCAGLLMTGGKDACQGDSGGPVNIDGVLTGVVSWGLGCAEPRHPGIYTNLIVLRSWIREVSGI